MSLAKKLNVKDGVAVHVLGRPDGVDLGDLLVSASSEAQGVLVFARTRADVDASAGPAIEAARADRLAWIAYPKAGQLGTDLNRDLLWKHLEGRGIQPVRQVAIDGLWSAMRFRPQA